MLNALGLIYLIGGVACIGFYLTISLFSRFGLSISWIWPAAGILLLAAAFLTRIHLPQWLRYGWRALLAAGLVWLLALECLVVSGMRACAPPGMDYLIVLGASVYPDGPSPGLTRRINAVMNCLDDHPNTVIIASGGQGANEPVSEARCIRDELVKRGVDPARIVMEDKSTDTRENIANSLALMARPDAQVGIVTNNYHVWRSVRLAHRAGMVNAHGIASEYGGPTLIHFMVREAISITVSLLRGYL